MRVSLRLKRGLLWHAVLPCLGRGLRLLITSTGVPSSHWSGNSSRDASQCGSTKVAVHQQACPVYIKVLRSLYFTLFFIQYLGITLWVFVVNSPYPFLLESLYQHIEDRH